MKQPLVELVESALDSDPLRQFLRWYDEAVTAGIVQANAMTLATASKDGKPSARMVLMKSADERGIGFFTNYASRKGRDLAENPLAALIFYWEEVARQVRIEGEVVVIPPEESDAYFASRPLENKLSSLASSQSEVVTREELDRRYEELRQQYAGRAIPRPLEWGGYRVVPARWEFWQRRFARLNDRIEYLRTPAGGWTMQRLAP